jgi:cytidylate kinase
MTHSTSLEQLTAGIARAQEHWHGRAGQRGAGHETAFTIALHREAGAPGTSVAHTVGERLHWPVYDQELVERIANDMGLRPALVASVDERRRSWLLDAVQGFMSAPGASESAYAHRLVQTLLSLGAHGHCVIVGRGSAFVLPQESTLRVRVVGNEKDRIEATRRRLGLSLAEAQRWVEETERERVRYNKDFFLKDLRNPVHYDLVLNTSRWSVAQCAEIIVDALRQLERAAVHGERLAAAH